MNENQNANTENENTDLDATWFASSSDSASSDPAMAEVASVGLWRDGRLPSVLCRAHKTNGEPCKRPPIQGATVCRAHGGALRLM